MTKKNANLCIVSGEASGDAQGALLIKALKEELELTSGVSISSIWGAAGPHLEKEGVEKLVDIEDLAVMGLAEILPKYLKISSAYKILRDQILIRKPIAVIFIDYPGFNLRLMREVYNLGITTIYHIPPKAWSHGEKRTELLRQYCYLVTSILPFETNFFKEKNVNVKFIGNPLKDSIDKFMAKNPTAKAEHKIAILPGSRENEIKKLLPILIEAFVELHKTENQLEAYIPIAINVSKKFVFSLIADIKKALLIDNEWFENKIKIGFGNAYSVLNECSYAWVCSGTASLEAAFFKIPMSVMYKISPITAFFAKRFLKIKYVSLVNLCTNKETVPEYLQENANAKNLIDHALFILKNKTAKQKMIQELEEIRAMFPSHAVINAAKEIANCIHNFNIATSEKFHIHDKMLNGTHN